MHDPAYWQHLSPWLLTLNIFPFAFLLLAIALMPLSARTARWWEPNRHKFVMAAACGLAGVALYYAPTRDAFRIGQAYLEYLAFLSLLGALFVVGSGIHISGAFAGLPWINTLFLGLGALLANLLGTTGASMLLIRPLIRANHLRRHKVHIIVFFIFIVSNCGGLLTPLGDPPLYLGFLRGVPFWWTLRLMPHWALLILLLLFVFHMLDEFIFVREDLETKKNLLDLIAQAPHRLRIQGRRNLLLLLLIVLVVWLSGQWLAPSLARHYSVQTADLLAKGLQILALCSLAAWSFKWTPPEVRGQNHFSFTPILEVAALFFGIFGAMLPALAVLEYNAPSFAITKPWQFFWLTGLLSSFLDNAPTYLSFTALAAGQFGLSPEQLQPLAQGFPRILAAISAGAVFMGANSYIGNGPNFMVKAIAEHAKIKMPSFFGYLAWSVLVLLPIFVLETFIFFR
jgi:Na+/H+ antiporter NhaD/arsenite permease-like protein